MDTAAAAGRRPLKVGIQLPEIERPVRWPELASMIRAIEDAGFDSIWTGDHFLYHLADGSAEAPWDAWSVLAAAAAVTSRVALGPLVTPIGFYNPAVLAKKAATVDEISGGRLVLGLGAGWNEVEFRGYGVPFDHRIARFSEAFTIVRTLLQEGEIDFAGEYFSARDCQLVPRSRPGGPPIMIGSVGERMLEITLPYVRAWNVWHTETRNSPGGVAPLVARVEAPARRSVAIPRPWTPPSLRWCGWPAALADARGTAPWTRLRIRFRARPRRSPRSFAPTPARAWSRCNWSSIPSRSGLSRPSLPPWRSSTGARWGAQRGSSPVVPLALAGRRLIRYTTPRHGGVAQW